MIEFMREGGMGMWAMLIAFVAVAVLAATRSRQRRAIVLGSGAFLCLLLGQVGMATGMEAVSAKYSQFPDKVAAIGTGLGELAHNGIFGAGLALVFGVAALITHRQSDRAAAEQAT